MSALMKIWAHNDQEVPLEFLKLLLVVNDRLCLPIQKDYAKDILDNCFSGEFQTRDSHVRGSMPSEAALEIKRV